MDLKRSTLFGMAVALSFGTLIALWAGWSPIQWAIQMLITAIVVVLINLGYATAAWRRLRSSREVR